MNATLAEWKAALAAAGYQDFMPIAAHSQYEVGLWQKRSEALGHMDVRLTQFPELPLKVWPSLQVKLSGAFHTATINVELLDLDPPKETPAAYLAALELLYREVVERLGCDPQL